MIWHKGLKKNTKAENIDFFKEKFTSINIKPTKNEKIEQLNHSKSAKHNRFDILNKVVRYFLVIFLFLVVFLVVFCLRKNIKCISGDCENGFGTAVYYNGDLKGGLFNLNDFFGYNIYFHQRTDNVFYDALYEDIYIGEFEHGKRIGGFAFIR